MQHDAQLSTIDYLKEEKSDWLLFDLADTRLNIIEWIDNNVLLSYTTGLKDSFSVFEEKLGRNYKSIPCTDLPWAEFEQRLCFLFDGILSLYNPEQIIFNEIYCAEAFISKNRRYRNWDYEYQWMNDHVKKMNPLFEKVYSLCMEKLKGCHIIRWPNNVLADEIHRWGIYPLHYHELYYEYAEKALSIITKRYDRMVEVRELEYLRQLFSEKFKTLCEKAMSNNVRADRDKWQSYSNVFKSLITKELLSYDENLTLQFENVLLAKGYKNIAIYGNTEITKVLCAVLLQSTTISIDYIVENVTTPISGFKTINRNSTSFPNCDLMIVADILGFNDIKVKLEKMNVSFPFVNAAEFIRRLPAMKGDGIAKIKAKIQSFEE